MSSRPSSDMTKFKSLLAKSRHVVVLTGAGVSAESGIPTFRGPGGYWRKWRAQDLATPEAFLSNPSLLWEFYHHRRENMTTKSPNAAHRALAKFEKESLTCGRRVVVITQNIDGLHRDSGSKNVIELHGNLFKTRCLKCHEVTINRDSPICESLRDRGAPEPDARSDSIPEKHLPRCKKESCGGLLRPHVIWFGESLESAVLDATQNELDNCDLCLLVGTSSVVYPAAGFAPELAAKGVPVAEFNMEDTPATHQLGFHFKGKAGELLPGALELNTETESA